MMDCINIVDDGLYQRNSQALQLPNITKVSKLTKPLRDSVMFEILHSKITCASIPKSTESFCCAKTKPYGFQLNSSVPLKKY